MIPLKNVLGGGDEARGYQLTMALFAVLSTALWLFTFATTRERIVPDASTKTDLRSDLREARRNGPWLVMVVAALFTLMNLAVRGGVTLFFMKYYVVDGDAPFFWFFDRTSFFFLSATASLLAGVAATPLFAKRFEKRTVMIVLSALNAVGLAAFFFIPADQYVVMLIVSCAATFIVGPTPAIVWSMYADCVDYGEWKSGRRTTGLIFSGALFAQKTGLAIGAGMAGWLLSVFGFVANAVQTDSAVLGIRLMFSIFPAALALLAVGAIFFYPLREADVQKIEAELEARRAARAAEI